MDYFPERPRLALVRKNGVHMKKILFISVLSIIAVKAFATDYRLVVNFNSESNNLCANNISITSFQHSMRIKGNRELGTYFNLDASEGDVIINSINKGIVKGVVKYSAHATTSFTRNKATHTNNIMQLNSVTKFGRFISSQSDNTLTLDFRDDLVIMEIERTYDEAFSSTGDWHTYQKCEYLKL